MANSVELQQQQQQKTEMPQLLLSLRSGHSTHGRMDAWHLQGPPTPRALPC